ncbi:MAG: redox-regulated ATPase YchF [Helicobacter sp.]|nr:redox-regulated ATPase YchF [Helicobacter sp.]
MGLSVGIVGLPNVGKSTTFNALTKTQNAQAANYPFCTIEPNKAIVPVPDNRLFELARIVNPERICHSMVEFVDIAGLVKGASKGEGLGNQFLANIKETEVILHIVRCFEDSNITHTEGEINPLRDVEIIHTELLIADMQTLEKRVEKLMRQAKSGTDKEAKAQLEIAQDLLTHIQKGEAVSQYTKKDDERFLQLDKELRFLTNKAVIYGANVDEEALREDNQYVKDLRAYADKRNEVVIKLCSKIEEELISLDEEEQREFLKELGAKESGLNAIITLGFNKLGLISYFTAGVKEVRSWTIHKGDKAPAAAGVIHKDFEKGFIRAEVIAYDDFIRYGGETKSKEAGAMRIEGKDYQVQDGDIMHFRFNV